MGEVKTQTLAELAQGFVSSCQPIDNGPMDCPEIVAAMAKASILGGAVGLRIEGINNLKAVRAQTSVPIIGIVKRDLKDSPVRITPFVEDIAELASAGADIIAIDATDRDRPVPINRLVEAIKSHGCLAMADCSNLEEGLYAQSLGVDIIGSTLSGHVSQPTPEMPDLELVRALAQKGCFVMAEGRYHSPQLAAQAIQAGANCVTVGSAITRIEHICQWFDASVKQAKAKAAECLPA
ncbi:N-acetylmannosamine-6-phosphate 2-epimerase [Vibrio sp. S4M6]|uniref:N-acetylmannosamine-6-phosphate 2-epimerase n=1 Tax=Vibrio sinus TaxID=2946865 RepID=UPI00202A2C4D|nr:N-acetylmannosamine-6-phosphate 2-epimerase [Vibrio sinus]MCL9783788.1 N-acetylmannosamine-6-phosphate 2-epimerase [Vibrio sinus]